MKSEAIDQVRSASTSADFASAIEALNAEHEAVKASRPAAERALQDAVFAGKGDEKARAAIQEIDARLLTLKAAIDGGKHRMAEAEKAEQAAELKAARDKMDVIVKQLLEAASKQAADIAAARASTAEMYALSRELELATGLALAAGLPDRERPNAVGIIRKGRGVIPAPDTSSPLVFAVRADRTLTDLLNRSPFEHQRPADAEERRERAERALATHAARVN